MSKISKLIGKRAGSLVVMAIDGKNSYGMRVLICLCDCGKEKRISEPNFGSTFSCGCYKRPPRKHGHCLKAWQSSEYRSWVQMKGRCYNPKNKRYKTYGTRGIIVCERWLYSFENFYKDMGDRPSRNHSLDRENNDGNYEPTNCRWATDLEQAQNKINNNWIEHDGKRMVFAAWARYLKTSDGGLRGFIKRHSFEKAYEYFTSDKFRLRIERMKAKKSANLFS